MQTFAGIKGRMQRKLDGWNEKFLSQVGREIFIKAAVEAIPTYSMGVFLLSKTLSNQLNSLVNRFWWSHQNGGSGITWMNWAKLSLSKDIGGMGFWDFEIFNLTMLAKQGWRLIQNLDSLVAWILKEIYFHASKFFM
jgi:hypothetical protein